MAQSRSLNNFRMGCIAAQSSHTEVRRSASGGRARGMRSRMAMTVGLRGGEIASSREPKLETEIK
jgi:hypothetical protein